MTQPNPLKTKKNSTHSRPYPIRGSTQPMDNSELSVGIVYCTHET